MKDKDCKKDRKGDLVLVLLLLVTFASVFLWHSMKEVKEGMPVQEVHKVIKLDPVIIKVKPVVVPVPVVVVKPVKAEPAHKVTKTITKHVHHRKGPQTFRSDVEPDTCD